MSESSFMWICHGVCRDVTYLACKSWQVIFRWLVTRSDVLEEVGSLNLFCWSRLDFSLLVCLSQRKVSTIELCVCIYVSLTEIFANAASLISVNTTTAHSRSLLMLNETGSSETPWGVLKNISCSVRLYFR